VQEELDLIAAQLPEGVRVDSGDDVLFGRGEWLFERDGGRRVLAQMRGDVILSPKAAQRWAYLLEARTAWLAERGIPYVFAVAPSKYVVLPEQLPEGVAVMPRRPVVQIVFWLEKTESEAEVVYPLEELQAETAERPTFSTHDSRWNANGAFVAYHRVLDALPRDVPVRRLARELVRFEWHTADGDLGDRLQPPAKRDALIGRPNRPAARLVSDNRVEGAGRIVVTHCDSARATSCIVFGDRAAYRMLPFLSESFGRMVFVHLHTLDHVLVEAEQPDVVIGLADESSLIDLPGDVEALGATEMAAQKLSAGGEAAAG
jgi:alginate O-acetyltransferase complex protein AlgJ